MRRYAPFLFLILFSALLMAAPERFDSPQSQLWLIAKTFLKIAVTVILVGVIIQWYRKNKP